MSDRIMRASVVLLAAGLGSACGGLSYRVDRDQLKEITIENKLLLFDAENDVSIALDEREAIHREIQQTKQDIQDADLQVADAEVDSSRAAAKGDQAREQVAYAAIEVFQLKIRYLEDQLAFLRDKLKAQDDLIRVAEAKFELAKAKLAKNNNVRGAADIEIADFEGQVDECVEKAKATFQALGAYEQEVEAVKKAWLDRRDQLMAASGGGVGSPWAEDGALWGRDEQ
jgi:chromosome segregation ATPase